MGRKYPSLHWSNFALGLACWLAAAFLLLTLGGCASAPRDNAQVAAAIGGALAAAGDGMSAYGAARYGAYQTPVYVNRFQQTTCTQNLNLMTCSTY